MKDELDRTEGELISCRAAEWFVRLHGDPSPGHRRDYWRWLKKSQEHVAAVLDVARVHTLLRRMKLPFSIVDGGPQADSNIVELFPDKRLAWRTLMPLRRPSVLRRWSVAAAVFVAVGLGLLVYSIALQFSDAIETRSGEWRVEVLADGSKLRVGPRSRLRVSFDDQRRVIHLMSGDAIFEVVHDARPFIVDTGLGTARAVGTIFGVTRTDDWMLVTVTEGVVAVVQRNVRSMQGPATVAHAADTSLRAEEVAVPAEHQVRVSKERLHPARPVNVERELAWAQGKLIFSNQTVDEAVGEFNRRNLVQIEVLDHTIRAHRVQGVFEVADPRAFASFLELAESLKLVRVRPNLLRLERMSAREVHETATLQAETT